MVGRVWVASQSCCLGLGAIMFVIVVFVAVSVVLGQIASDVSKQPIVPQLQHRPGTPTEVVSSCWQSVVSTATEHAKELGAELVRVDATSAGEMRRVGRLESAPIEVGVVYSRGGVQELRQGVIECRVDSRGSITLASLPSAAR